MSLFKCFLVLCNTYAWIQQPFRNRRRCFAVRTDGEDQYSALRVSELRELLQRRGEERLSGLTKPRLLERLRTSLAAEATDADIIAASSA